MSNFSQENGSSKLAKSSGAVKRKINLTSLSDIKNLFDQNINMSEESIFQACTAQVGDAQNVTGLLQCISDANQAVSDDKPYRPFGFIRHGHVC
jgi:hypothetical protein